MTPRSAAFLDRDGTLMVDSGYIGTPNRVHVLAGVPQALRDLEDAGFARIVVTNQSGVARGYFDEFDVASVNRELGRQLAQSDAKVDAYYYCTHLVDCNCRKPMTGMVEEALGALDITLEGSVVFGDTAADMGLAANLGIPGILVNARLPYTGPKPLHTAASLRDGVAFFLEHIKVRTS